ncbi:MAG: AMP-binding protein, partial [Thermodesulfobacteriota bacterium]|nr:AMP-binding protein [Thermodesulfobacteriota bacterium]
KIGAVLIPINTRFKTHELEYVLHHSDSSTLIMNKEFLGINYVDMISDICPELARSEPGTLNSERLPLLKRVICSGEKAPAGMYSLEAVMEWGNDYDQDNALSEVKAGISTDDIAHIPYTSGTTGNPKGVMTTHKQYLWFNNNVVDVLEMTENDRFITSLPFCHNYGNCAGIYFPALSGGTSIILEYFNPPEVLKIIEKEKGTVVYGTPTMYIKMLEEPDFGKYDYSSLRLALTAAAPASVKLIEDIRKNFGGAHVLNGYGMTENSVGTSLTRFGDSPEIISTTVGRPMKGASVKVVDTETGEDLPPGKEGEFCTKGILVMKGYYKMPEETARLIDKDGWFHTGDLAILREDGYIKISGRLKDVIMPGGLNFSAVEVEDFITTHPAVQQVAVVGIPDEVMGEIGMAFVKLKSGRTSTEEEILNHCKGNLANYKVPKYVKFVDDFPLTPLEKIQKFKLKDQAVKELGLGE